MRIIFIFILLFGINWALFAAEPIIKVAVPESKQVLELYEDSDGLFAMKVMEYYKNALMLETQLKMMGIESKTKAIQPTFEEFEDLEYKVILKYFNIAKKLEDEVVAAPQTEREMLYNKINELELAIRDSVANQIQRKGIELNKFLDKSMQGLRKLDETYSKNLELIRDSYENNCMNSYSLISVSGKGNIFFSNGGDFVRNDPWLSLKGTVNAGRISGFWKDFNVWYEYLAPKFFTQYDKNSEFRHVWNTNGHAVGGGGKIPVSVQPHFKHGLNLELGYFWLKGNIENLPNNSVNWDGMNFNLEYYAGVPSCRFPFEMFVDFSIYHNFSKNLRFYTGRKGMEVIDIGKTHMAISLGIRYNLLVTDLDF